MRSMGWGSGRGLGGGRLGFRVVEREGRMGEMSGEDEIPNVCFDCF